MATAFPLSIEPSYGTKPNFRARVNSAQLGGAYGQLSKDGIHNIEVSWNVVFQAIRESEKTILEDFLIARGGWDGILWTPPGGVQQTFTCERWSFTPVAAGAYDASMNFKLSYAI